MYCILGRGDTVVGAAGRLQTYAMDCYDHEQHAAGRMLNLHKLF